ncbi:hypothetical protein B0H19DRAFT_127431 [Mycena capillaripes]|nr:hypothetical protein B0H19DRAFT_127431 [Mycena capillaripes]
MKRSRQQATQIVASTSLKKSKVNACLSCKKNKTRCELLDTTTSPVQCHRCQVIGIHCSYEETLVAAVPESPPEPPAPRVNPASNSNTAPQTFRPRPEISFQYKMPPTDRMWEFVSKDHEPIDWSAPMLAIQNLARLPPITNPTNLASSSSPRETSLANILDQVQIRYLLEIFDRKYTPWLNFRLIRNSGSSLLDTVCCTIASRYLDPSYSTFHPNLKTQLQGLTEDLIIRMIFNPRSSESIEAIQALLILSLWEPVGGSENEGRDGRVLLASAVSMAMNLRLNQASAKAESLKNSTLMNGGYMSEEDVIALDEMLEHARLWVSITNAESMLCLGTGRVPLSRRSVEDKKLIEYPTSLVGLSDYRNLRLGLVAMQSSIAEEGVSLHINASSEIDGWYDKITAILESLKRGRRFLLPLPVVLDHEQFYFHILHIFDGICRLLVLYHAFWEARVAIGHIPIGETWHHCFRPHGVDVVSEWGRDMIQTSEAILVYVAEADVDVLGTACDVFFHMVALAAGYIVGVKFLMHRTPGNGGLMGGSDLLLAKTANHLARAARGPGHSAQKCALLINGMIAKWEARGSLERPAYSTHSTPPSSSDQTSSDGSYYPGDSPLGAPRELGFSMFLDSSMALDEEFWKQLQENQELAVGHHKEFLPDVQ